MGEDDIDFDKRMSKFIKEKINKMDIYLANNISVYKKRIRFYI